MKNSEIREIKTYLIRSFLIVLAAVVLTTMPLVALEKRIFSPILSGILTQETLQELTPILMGKLFWALLRKLIFQKNAGLEMFRDGSSPNAVLLGLIVLLFLVMTAIAVAPSIIGAVVFAELISRQLSKIEKQRQIERETFEGRRNLMLSNMAHDLRTPLTSIRGMADAMAEGLVSEEQRGEYLKAITLKTVKMADLVSILFEYTKLNSEGFKLNKESLNLTDLLLEETACAYTDIEEAGMELEIDVPEVNFRIKADPAHLRRLVTNLLNNAIRHNPKGTKILLRMELRPGVAIVSVADNGVPLKGKAQELFEPFVRGDDARTSDGGSGLGLSICRKVAGLHGYGLTLVQPYPGYTKAFVLSCSEERPE